MRNQQAISDRLQAVFAAQFHVVVPSADTDLLDSGLLDSLQFVELLVSLEREFGFRIAIESIELDDLRTLGRLAVLLHRHLGPDWAPAIDGAAPIVAAAGNSTGGAESRTQRTPAGREAPRTRIGDGVPAVDAAAVARRRRALTFRAGTGRRAGPPAKADHGYRARGR